MVFGLHLGVFPTVSYLWWSSVSYLIRPRICVGGPHRMDKKLRISDVEMKDKRVIIRVDFSVMFDKQDPSKIINLACVEVAVPTIQYCFYEGARSVVLASHMGCPNGKKEPQLSVEPVAKALQGLINRPVTFLDDCVGSEVEKATAKPDKGSVFLLGGSPEQVDRFRDNLAKNCDIYVCDAPGALHLKPHVPPCPRAAGILVAKEFDAFKVWSCVLCQQVS